MHFNEKAYRHRPRFPPRSTHCYCHPFLLLRLQAPSFSTEHHHVSAEKQQNIGVKSSSKCVYNITFWRALLIFFRSSLVRPSVGLHRNDSEKIRTHIQFKPERPKFNPKWNIFKSIKGPKTMDFIQKTWSDQKQWISYKKHGRFHPNGVLVITDPLFFFWFFVSSLLARIAAAIPAGIALFAKTEPK